MNDPLKNKALEDIINFYRIDENIATSGQPKAGQFKEICAEGYEIVFNLALNDSPNAIEDEGKIINELNMQYVHIPVDFSSPSLEDLKLFFKHMEKHENKKIFVHCAMNRRVSAFMFLYHTIMCQVPFVDATRHIDAVWQPDPVWQDFIGNTLRSYGIHPD